MPFYNTRSMDQIRDWARNACNPAMVKAVAEHVQTQIQSNPRPTIYGALIAVTLIWIAFTLFRRVKASKTAARPRTPDLEKPLNSASKFKPADREPGGTSQPQTISSTQLTSLFQYGHPHPSSAQPLLPIQIGPSKPPSPSPTDPSAMAPNTM